MDHVVMLCIDIDRLLLLGIRSGLFWFYNVCAIGDNISSGLLLLLLRLVVLLLLLLLRGVLVLRWRRLLLLWIATILLLLGGNLAVSRPIHRD